MASNPVTKLNNLFASIGCAGGVNYKEENVEGVDENVARKCIITCSEVGGDVGLEPQVFVGYGRNKKAAKSDAAVNALNTLEANPSLMKSQKLSLSDAVQKAFSEKVRSSFNGGSSLIGVICLSLGFGNR